MNTKPTIRVDVVSDIVCPWCYIGKRRLEKAIEDTQSSCNLQVIYHPFQLDPSVPKEGMDFKTHMENRFGAGFSQKFRQVEQAAQTVDLEFDFDNLPKAINTFTFHRILMIALQEGIQIAVKEALMKAYFVDKIDLTIEKEVVDLMSQFDWTEEKTLNILRSDEGSDEVKEEMHYFRQQGVSGVPFFIFDKKYAVSGAQPSDVFVEIFQQLAQEKQVQAISGDVCDVDGEDC
jgi:predicted DsbA family dithiol-disulfide isomerase